jgi:hypothetical protein
MRLQFGALLLAIPGFFHLLPDLPPSAGPVTPAVAAGPTSKPCASPEHRRFDFWIGEWRVVNSDGTPAGTNRIESILGGCALQENWAGKGGMKGRSLNSYDARTGRWHQTWVDDRGDLLLLEGGWRDGKMILEGTRPGKRDQTERNRICWARRDGDRVRQLWEVSVDGGKSWKVVFDGTYLRSSPAAAGGARGTARTDAGRRH